MAKAEKHLSDLCDHIRSSLAEKRACSIHLVCIVPISMNNSAFQSGMTSTTHATMTSSAAFVTLENEKIHSLRNVCKLSPGAVSILHYQHEYMGSPASFQLSELLKLESRSRFQLKFESS